MAAKTNMAVLETQVKAPDDVDTHTHAQVTHPLHVPLHMHHLQLSSMHEEPQFSGYDVKSKHSKYKRWTPKMDQYLVHLLLDVVHSFHAGEEVKMTKKAWAYVTSKLRAANPETVYATYTKYSCHQHLINVIHHRYRFWHSLMAHMRHNQTISAYSYRWDINLGRFIVLDPNGMVIEDERLVKSLIYGDGVSLPSFNGFNRSSIMISDLFFSDSLRYMSVYHNEVYELMLQVDAPAFSRGLEGCFELVPKFDYPEASREYLRPLVPVKAAKGSRSQSVDTSPMDASVRRQLMFALAAAEEPVENMHKRRHVAVALGPAAVQVDHPADFENAIASAAMVAIETPPVSANGRDPPVYFKERKWFNKLMALYNDSHITADEVLSVCEGVRDGKIPLFMLNVLDNTYYGGQGHTHDPIDDLEMVKRIRQFMIPMTFSE